MFIMEEKLARTKIITKGRVAVDSFMVCNDGTLFVNTKSQYGETYTGGDGRPRLKFLKYYLVIPPELKERFLIEVKAGDLLEFMGSPAPFMDTSRNIQTGIKTLVSSFEVDKYIPPQAMNKIDLENPFQNPEVNFSSAKTNVVQEFHRALEKKLAKMNESDKINTSLSAMGKLGNGIEYELWIIKRPISILIKFHHEFDAKFNCEKLRAKVYMYRDRDARKITNPQKTFMIAGFEDERKFFDYLDHWHNAFSYTE